MVASNGAGPHWRLDGERIGYQLWGDASRSGKLKLWSVRPESGVPYELAIPSLAREPLSGTFNGLTLQLSGLTLQSNGRVTRDGREFVYLDFGYFTAAPDREPEVMAPAGLASSP